MAQSILRDKAKDFSISIVFLCRSLRAAHVEPALVNQLLRSGTSIGANIHEAQYAQSRKDFVSKLEIALKECNECDYWIELMLNTNDISGSDYQSFHKTIIDLRRMLVSSVKTVKSKDSSLKTES